MRFKPGSPAFITTLALTAALFVPLPTAQAQPGAAAQTPYSAAAQPPSGTPAQTVPGAQGQSAANAATQGKAQAPENYAMGAGDRINVNVYDTPELSIKARISENGSINYPLLGSINLDGLTETEAASKIADRLKQENILKQPSVTVTVESFQSRRVTVIGEVPNPGEYFLSDERSVVGLLGKAGWIKPDGADYLLLTRTDNGKETQMRLSLNEVTSGARRGMQVQAGDVIFVPKQEQFFIQGAVQSPGAYRLTRNMTVIEALSVGGGLTPRGSRGRIEVKRKGEAGKVTTYDAELNDTLKPNDTIYVKERLF